MMMVSIAFVIATVQMHAVDTFAFHVSPSHTRTNTIPSITRQRPLSLLKRGRSRSIVLPTSDNTFSSSPSYHPSNIILHGLFDDDEGETSESEIPPELRDEIYAAESNTPAAQGRQIRVAFYILATLVGVTTAFFNAFLSDLRFGDGAPSTDLNYYGFGWVQDNPILSFFFLNKIGGGIGLLGAGLSGTLAEVEIRSKKENAEKIWAEIQRRKSAKESPKSKKSNRKKNKKRSSKDMTGKQKKRLSALEELMVEDEAPVAAVVEEAKPVQVEEAVAEKKEEEEESKDAEEGGVFGKIKGFYKKADSMAASQALLLNKELEDRGLIDKITDETGLKVVGKEEAAAAAAKKGTEEKD
mmetsp:Transcript_19289/g.33090  ORF Transcript_19289/g.33090 Transcript_19289/m.33090 type:complete len:355 (+) Transcript_19289:82-1146(+)